MISQHCIRAKVVQKEHDEDHYILEEVMEALIEAIFYDGKTTQERHQSIQGSPIIKKYLL